jgi:UDP:flavonoid glycosyltransferase YjiC (YdhE family)
VRKDDSLLDPAADHGGTWQRDSVNARRRVVLATFGTYGDLHPFIAIALALRDHGFEPIIATSSVYRRKIESEGIGFRRLRPEQDTIERDLGVTRAELIRQVARRPEFVLRRMLLPYLRQSYEDSLVAIAGADLVVTHTTALATKIAAEKLGLPHLGAVLQPMALLSEFDPPALAPVPGLMRWIQRRGPAWSRALIRVIKYVSRSWAAPIDELRRDVGLPASASHPFFDGQFTAEGVLALYSQVLGGPQPDHPPRTAIIGFAFYDAEYAGATRLEPALADFLANGEPPLVFTLGTSAVYDASDFVKASLAATAELRWRAVFVLDVEQRDRWQAHASSNVMFCSYAPYSQLFPRAAVVIHHGGVGTTAQALRAGRPQLIVPYLIDQPDNAARVERLGAGRSLALRRYRSRRVAAELRFLLDDPDVLAHARRVAAEVSGEDGANAAVRIIAAVLNASSERAQRH